jgi:NifB/MoaA-like Fe-S oxidoreductase
LQTKTKISIVTSTLVYDIFIKKIKPTLNKITNLEVNFFQIKNNFFGDSVTVAGLLTGKDIISQLKGKDLGNSVWTTYRILNDDQTLTLDDMTLGDISKALQTKFKVSKNDSINDIIKSITNET